MTNFTIPDKLHPQVPLHKGTFKEAETLARKDTKFLCILLTCSDHPSFSSSYLSNVFTKDTQGELPTLLSQRCVIWAGDIDEVAEDVGVQRGIDSVITICNPVSFPYFAITFKNKLMMDIQGGGFDAEDFKRELNQCFKETEAVHARELAFALDRQARDSEREAQERAEREMMEADKRKMEEKKRREDEKVRQEREEQERLDRLLKEAEERKQLEEEKQREAETRKALAVSAVPDEPSKETTPADQIATIRLTLLRDGKTATRLFYRSSSLAGLYAWAESLPDYDMAIDGEIELMAAGNPPKILERSDSVTIGETKALIPRCVVTMKRSG